jgi:adenylate kinase
MLNVILLGPPGAGKGTQARAIAGSLGLRHLSTGEMLRQHIHDETPLGVQARVFYDKGEYVPDRVVVAMVREELCCAQAEEGVVLDGFPRTVAQAEALRETLADLGRQIDAVIELETDSEEIVRRAEGRRVCPAGHTFHIVSNPPRVANRCDIDDLPLQQRVDDRPATVRRRLEVYHGQTKPLVDFYAEKQLLRSVDGTQPIAAVTESIRNVLSEVGVH